MRMSPIATAKAAGALGLHTSGDEKRRKEARYVYQYFYNLGHVYYRICKKTTSMNTTTDNLTRETSLFTILVIFWSRSVMGLLGRFVHAEK
jgi:hypothetical protein